ncbi:hypothetical protein ACMFMG_010499 [Clarireedia jacksonii]
MICDGSPWEKTFSTEAIRLNLFKLRLQNITSIAIELSVFLPEAVEVCELLTAEETAIKSRDIDGGKHDNVKRKYTPCGAIECSGAETYDRIADLSRCKKQKAKSKKNTPKFARRSRGCTCHGSTRQLAQIL